MDVYDKVAGTQREHDEAAGYPDRRRNQAIPPAGGYPVNGAGAKKHYAETDACIGTTAASCADLLRQRAWVLRQEAEDLDALASALPAGLASLSPRANNILLQMFGSSQRVYLGGR
jgi:hypothetical protein